MLVISRKVGESIILSDDIKITVVALGNDKAVIGIDAPKNIQVIREELLETIQANLASVEKQPNNKYKHIASKLKSCRFG